MHIKDAKAFKNGVIYTLCTEDGYETETVVIDDEIQISCWVGCPVKCSWCASSTVPFSRALTVDEIWFQMRLGDLPNSRIKFIRHGEPFLNLKAVKAAIRRLHKVYPQVPVLVSTVGLPDQSYSWVKGNIQLQMSLTSFNLDDRMPGLLPVDKFHNIKCGNKILLNVTMKAGDFSVEKCLDWFPADKFTICLSELYDNPATLWGDDDGTENTRSRDEGNS